MKNVLRLCAMELRKLCELRLTMGIYLALSPVLAISTRMMMVGYIMNIYAVLFTLASYDDNSYGGALMISLPVNRRQMVQARYLFSCLYMAVIAVVLFAVNRLAAPLLPPELNDVGVGFMMAAQFLGGALFIAVMQPVSLCLGVTKARYGMVFLYMAVFFGMYHAISVVNRDWEQMRWVESLSPWFWLAGALLLAVSYLIAMRFFLRKQFDL